MTVHAETIQSLAPTAGADRTLRAFGWTDPGGRPVNEDRFVCDPDRGLFVVADGVGGYQAGEVAAGVACEVLSRWLSARTGSPDARMRSAFRAANNEIYRRSFEAPGQIGMACVATAAWVEQDQVIVGHVGDTRLYEVQHEAIRKVTRDHSIVGLQEDAGWLTEAEAMRHPRRNEILRDLGERWQEPEEERHVDVYAFTLAPGTTLVLCSDGLTDVVPSTIVHEVARQHAEDPETIARTLVAHAAGGDDNVTVVVVCG